MTDNLSPAVIAKMIDWDAPPATDEPTSPNRQQIGRALSWRPGQWAIVARHDRAARAAAHVGRVQDGREYGVGFDAVARQVGPEHRVYARKMIES